MRAIARRTVPLGLSSLAALALCLGGANCGDSSKAHACRRCLPVLPLGLHSLMPVPMQSPLTVAKAALGERLFFDPSLSRNGAVSCSTCHQPHQAYTDGRARAVGIDQRTGRRNVPTLLNSAYAKSLFWDGRVDALETLVFIPLTSHKEMDSSMEAIIEKLSADRPYRQAFASAFGSPHVTPARIAQALASFQRTLVAGNSRFDHYTVLKDASALSDSAQRGLKLFRGKARCAHCHEGPLFTDQRFHNTGIGWGEEPLDLGRYEHTGVESDKGKFKTPTLRDVARTAPYMHDGSLATLGDVLDFYDRGANSNPHLDGTIRRLHLTAGEKNDLIAFLLSLTSGP